MTAEQHGRIRRQACVRGILFATLEPRDQHGLARLECDLLDCPVAIDRDLLDLRALALISEGDCLDWLGDGVVVSNGQEDLPILLGIRYEREDGANGLFLLAHRHRGGRSDARGY